MYKSSTAREATRKFQSLIGQLQMLSIDKHFILSHKVSIPYRLATNDITESEMEEWLVFQSLIGQLQINYNSISQIKTLMFQSLIGQLQMYNEVWYWIEIDGFNPLQVSYKYLLKPYFYLFQDKFQSLIGQLQIQYALLQLESFFTVSIPYRLATNTS